MLGLITWIGGLIVAIAGSYTVQMDGYNAKKVFSFALFLTNIVIYGIAGGALYCLAELLQNVQSIANALNDLKVIGTIAEPLQTPTAAVTTNPTTSVSVAPVANAVTVEDAPKKASAPVSAGKITAILDALEREGVEFVDPAQLGELGEQLVQSKLFRRETISAPEGMSEAEAKAAGYSNWDLNNGKKRFWKLAKYVPNITAERLEEILAQNE